MPTDWAGGFISEKGLWSYQAEGGHEQLTVSVYSWTEPMNPNERHALFERLVKIGRGAAAKMTDAIGLTATDPTFGEADGVLAARYSGTDSAHRRFQCLMLGSTQSVAIFYYEAVEMSEPEADTRARIIFNSIAVPR